jgi:ketosteroid isomerase-like protein
MKVRALLMALSAAAVVPLATPLTGQSAPRVATTLTKTELAELEVVRRKVWLDWFAGDTAALRQVLGPELVAVGTDSPHWQTLDQTLAASAWFKESGGRLLEISFDSTVVHRLGDVAVMFSHYAMRTSRSGTVNSRTGRVTEVFVRQRGRWVHTSWHLDAAVSSTEE